MSAAATIPGAVPIALAGAEILLNPRRGGPYTEAMAAILSDPALAEARAAIASWPGYAPTPLHSLPGLAAALGVARIDYKDEAPRFGLGSFKALGGAYAVFRLLAGEVERRTGRRPSVADLLNGAGKHIIDDYTVTTATDGNHGRSVAWGARLFGCKAVIFIHATVSEGRKSAIAAYGAEVRRTAGTYDDSVREAKDTAAREGWSVVSDTSWNDYTAVPTDVMRGYEVMAAEAFDILDEPPTHILLQTGVGAMAAAVAACAFRRYPTARPTIVLADPDKAACFFDSIAAGRPVAVAGDLDTMMAGLACGEVSELAWTILSGGADAVAKLPDESAISVMRLLARPPFGDRPIVAGESAVAGLAALAACLADSAARAALALGRAARILIFGSEGDTDPALYEALVGEPADAVRSRAETFEKTKT